MINWRGGEEIPEDFTEEVIFVKEYLKGKVGISKAGKRMGWRTSWGSRWEARGESTGKNLVKGKAVQDTKNESREKKAKENLVGAILANSSNSSEL